eukprot:TRINITY_DN19670_c0_g1_i1.p1 TRINITY_DN19670_c0_g1~~TRINITY_DN19670_c0_g1_i1.p1  ORF type:complete len:371 (+),score=47.86 TRINITY_DN19670_c0_g1_i1:137-1114(+)
MDEEKGKLKVTPTPSPRESRSSGESVARTPSPSPRYSEVATRQLNRPSHIVTRAEYDLGEPLSDSYTIISALIVKVLILRFSSAVAEKGPSSDTVFTFYRCVTFCHALLATMSAGMILLHVVDMGTACCADVGPSELEVGYVYNFSFPTDCASAHIPQTCPSGVQFSNHCGDDALDDVFDFHSEPVPATLVTYIVSLAVFIGLSCYEMLARHRHWVVGPICVVLHILLIVFLSVSGNKTQTRYVGCDYWAHLEEETPTINKAILRECLDLVSSCGNRLRWIITNINASGFHAGWVLGMVVNPLNAAVQLTRYAAGLQCSYKLASL